MESLKTIRNIFKIDFLTYIFIIISFLTGQFKTIIIYMLLIIIHELGHFLAAKLFNWKVDKIYIYPLGGVTKFNENINKPLIEEFLITIMGPIFQVVFSIFLFYNFDISFSLSNKLLLFNLLPITPLDGSKLFNIFSSLVKPFKISLILSIKVSYIFYFGIILLSYFFLNSKFILIVEILLIFKIIDEKKRSNYYFNKFLLERYLYKYNFKHTKVVKSVDEFYKYHSNIINKRRIYNEKEILNIYFNS